MQRRKPRGHLFEHIFQNVWQHFLITGQSFQDISPDSKSANSSENMVAADYQLTIRCGLY